MKKYIIVFLVLSIAGIIFLVGKNYFFANKTNYIYINNDQFFKKDKPFYPIIVNYIAGFQSDGKNIWPCPTKAYNLGSKFQATTKESCLQQLKADMQLIKKMGFNALRIVGIGEEYLPDNDTTGELAYAAALGNQKDTVITLFKKEGYDDYLKAIGEILKIVDEAGLKSILLIRMSVDIQKTEQNLGKVVAYFKNDTSILAFDIFNEPLYFDKPDRTKQVVYDKVKKWRNIIKSNSPNHLVTIGLTGVREVFEWDPNILDVDFISYHPYEYEPEQVRNEIYWYGKYVKKPWIIGETAVPADNDSVPYSEQKTFAERTIKQAYNCGAYGYSWWQYKDVEWFAYHANFMGMLNLQGTTKVNDSLTVNGTVKPVAQVIKEFNPQAKKEKCLCFDNYYNYSMKDKFRLKGKLIDENDKPIEGGIILGWNEYWSSSYHTISKADGSFELLGSFPFYHWMLSATEKTMLRGEALPDTAKIDHGMPTINLGEFKLTKLPFSTN